MLRRAFWGLKPLQIRQRRRSTSSDDHGLGVQTCDAPVGDNPLAAARRAEPHGDGEQSRLGGFRDPGSTKTSPQPEQPFRNAVIRWRGLGQRA